jgi:TatD DNase family protein
MIAILKNTPDGKFKAIMHCFSSTKKLADFALEKGLYLSFSGIVTFPKALEIQEICKAAPIDRILVETDAPYLAPVPYRGKRNEPAFVSHTGRFVAKLHNKEESEMAAITSQNFFNLFSKIKK